MPSKEIWTIGHSTHSFEKFIGMLKSFRIELLADIRSFPGSRRYPHFNKQSLAVSLPADNIDYVHLVDLGGRRKPCKDSANTGWRVEGFRGYADYMETEAFRNAVETLEKIAFSKRVAFMCAEAVWWRCHRSLVADYLKHKGWIVNHIFDTGKSEEHPYTGPARIINDELVYTKK